MWRSLCSFLMRASTRSAGTRLAFDPAAATGKELERAMPPSSNPPIRIIVAAFMPHLPFVGFHRSASGTLRAAHDQEDAAEESHAAEVLIGMITAPGRCRKLGKPRSEERRVGKEC